MNIPSSQTFRSQSYSYQYLTAEYFISIFIGISHVSSGTDGHRDVLLIILSRVWVTVDGVWIDYRIYWSLGYNTWLRVTVHCYTRTHTHTRTRQCPQSLPLLGNGLNGGRSPSSGLPDWPRPRYQLLTAAAPKTEPHQSSLTHSLFSNSHSESESESELLYDWRLTAKQFVLAPSPWRITTRVFFLQLNPCSRSLFKESVQIRGPLWHFVTSLFFTVRTSSPTPNPQAGGPLLVGCQRLLIKYIRS
jgi:hypothetical protein